MELAQNTRLYEHSIATLWFDKEGILHALSKPGPRSIEIMRDYISFLQKLLNNKRACVLADISKAHPMDKETRDFTAKELPKVYKAVAIISKSVLGRMIAKVFLHLEKPGLPMKIFTTEKEAKEWLRPFLRENGEQEQKLVA